MGSWEESYFTALLPLMFSCRRNICFTEFCGDLGLVNQSTGARTLRCEPFVMHSGHLGSELR